LEWIGGWADTLRSKERLTAKRIAGELEKLIRDITKARAGVQDLKKKHWPRQGLYQDVEKKLDAAMGALTQAADVLLPEQDVLAAAPDTSTRNANSPDAVFRRHVLRIWREVGGEKLGRTDAIDFLFVCETFGLGKPKREAVQKWLARNWPTADTPR
jgi:hypothetical protein